MKFLLTLIILSLFSFSSFASPSVAISNSKKQQEQAKIQQTSESQPVISGANRFFVCDIPRNARESLWKAKINETDMLSDGFCPIICDGKDDNSLNLAKNGFSCTSKITTQNNNKIIFVPFEKIPKILNPEAQFKGISYNQYLRNVIIYYWLEHSYTEH